MAKNDNVATAWVGWAVFAGFMMMISGLFQAVAGLTGLLKHSWFVVSSTDQLLVFNYQTWGWINLLIGIFILLAGVSVLHGSVWARIVGVLLAASSAVASLVSINQYPIWSIIIITIDVLVIYALTVHGGELKD